MAILITKDLCKTYGSGDNAVHALNHVSLTVEDIHRFQTYLESHSTTLMADGQKLTCICID